MRGKRDGLSVTFRNYTGETWIRLIIQSATWRVGGVLLAILLAWLMTGNLLLGLEFGLVYNTVRFFTYLIHQRLWQYVGWGTKRTSETTDR